MKLELLIISPIFLKKNTVATQRMDSLIDYMLQKGENVNVICNNLDEKRQYNNAINVYAIDENQYEKNIIKILALKKIDILLITLGPYFTLPLVTKIKENFTGKIILDYRDLWTFDFRGKSDILKVKKNLKRIPSYFIEKKAINSADLIVTVSDIWSKKIEKYFLQSHGKVKVIENGYNEKIFEQEIKNNGENIERFNKSTVNIFVFGKLGYYSKWYTKKVFKAIKKFKKNNNASLQLFHIGNKEVYVEKIVDKFRVRDNYKNIGYLSYKDGIELMKKKATAFMIIDNRKGAIGTKIYDYIALNRPIIYVGPKNAIISDIIKKLENGFSCQNKKDILRGLKIIKGNDVLDNNIDITFYSRKMQNKKYYELLKNLIKI